jgi:hypothetical protein
MLFDFCVSHFSDEQQKHFLTHRCLTQQKVSMLQHASAHKWGKVQGQYPCMRFRAAGSSSGAANAVSLFNSRTSYCFIGPICLWDILYTFELKNILLYGFHLVSTVTFNISKCCLRIFN